MRLAASIGLLLTGCFYIDPINQRPTIGIEQQTGGLVHRGGRIALEAAYFDPEGQDGSYAWRAFACGEDGAARRGVGCDEAAFYTGTQATAALDVPVVLARGAPVQSIRVRLEARDDRGALSQTQMVLPVVDGLPALELRKSARSYTIDLPIELFAKYGDPDDGPANVALTWQVFTPNTQPAFELEELVVPPDPSDPAHATAGKTLVPHGTGEWGVYVTARDPLGAVTEQHLAITVVPDRPPCLAQWQPIAPPDGATLPITDPTVFQVPLVDDDLDAYPPVLGDPVLGATTFAWSILPPGAPRQLLVGATGNRIDFDPSAFTPGDIVEVRVEIFDRVHTSLPCAGDAPVCSVSALASCIQRQTWRVEVR